jgi:hypothetical protein
MVQMQVYFHPPPKNIEVWKWLDSECFINVQNGDKIWECHHETKSDNYETWFKTKLISSPLPNSVLVENSLPYCTTQSV